MTRYRTLGTSLVMNVILNVVTPHIYWLVLWGIKIWKWKNNKAKAISQEALNKLTKGLRWEVWYFDTTVIQLLGSMRYLYDEWAVP